MKKFNMVIFMFIPFILHAESPSSAQIILIGEQHGKTEQIKAATKLIHEYYIPQKTALALEHIHQNEQNKLTHWLKDYKNPDQLAIDIEWWKSGWPNWMIYRPLFQEAYKLNMPLIATDEITVLPSQTIQNIWDESYDHAYKAWQEIIKDYHGGDIEEKKLDELTLLQMSRDIHMAQAISQYLKKYPENRIIYFAGQDHIRNDYSVPSLLREYQTFSIALNCPKLNHIFNQIIPQCN